MLQWQDALQIGEFKVSKWVFRSFEYFIVADVHLLFVQMLLI
jgi:hypothetical protein